MKMRLRKNELILSLAIFFCFPLLGLTLVSPSISVAYSVVSLLILGATLCFLLRHKVEMKFFSPFFYYIYLLGTTILQKGDFIQAGSSFVRDLCVFSLVAYCIKKGRTKQLIMTSNKICDIFLILNGCHMLVSSDGFGLTRALNKIFLLAPDNSLILYIIAFVVVHELRNQIKPFSIVSNCLYYAVVFYELYRGEAATSYFIIAIMIPGIILARKIAINRYIYVGYGFVAFLNVFLIFIRKFSFMQSIFSVMGKEITLSRRTRIWDLVLELIRKQYLWGYGVADNMHYININGNLNEAHNMALSLLLQGGIILLILFILMLIQYGWILRGSDSISYRYLAIGILSYLVVFLVESPPSVPGLYFILALIQMEDFGFEQNKDPVLEQDFKYRQSSLSL